MGEFSSNFSIGDKVLIDGEESIKATIIGIAFFPSWYEIKVGWFNSGNLVETWVAKERLSLFKER